MIILNIYKVQPEVYLIHMSLKINYLDSQKKALKNKALFVSKESKISDFKGILDDKTNQKILNFIKI